MQSITNTVDIGNGQKGIEILIGQVTVREAFKVRTSEQTACNYYEIEVGPGVYDITKTVGHGTEWVMIRYTGIITDEHFVNRLFHASSIAEKRDIGKPSRRAARQMYGYMAAEQFATNPDWELAEDWSIEMITRSHDPLPGRSERRPYKSYALKAPTTQEGGA